MVMNPQKIGLSIDDLPKKVAETESRMLSEDESNGLQGEGMKFFISSNTIDSYTRLEVLLGFSLSGHTETLAEVSNLIDEKYRKGEIQNKKQYREAVDNVDTN